MMKNFKRFAVVAAATGLFAQTALAASTMNRSDIEAQIIDKPIVFVGVANGLPVRGVVRYSTGNRIRVKTALGKEMGVWSFKGDAMCTRLPSAGNKATCFAIAKQGKGRFQTSHGFVLVTN
ncbi:MAG: hypothetical protein AAGF28_11995 [Pseudomonadota bacterium]